MSIKKSPPFSGCNCSGRAKKAKQLTQSATAARNARKNSQVLGSVVQLLNSLKSAANRRTLNRASAVRQITGYVPSLQKQTPTAVPPLTALQNIIATESDLAKVVASINTFIDAAATVPFVPPNFE